MSEAIEEGTSQLFIVENLGPVSKTEIGGNDQGDAFVESRTELKNELSALSAEGDETKLVDNEQIEFEGLGDELRQQMVFLGQDEFVDQSSGIVEPHFVA